MNEIAHTFECPSCGASLQAPGGAATMNCAYCGTSVVVPQDLRESLGAKPQASAPTSMDLSQLIAEAIRMGQVVRLARGDLRSEAIQLYRQNTGVDAHLAEQVIEAIVAGKAHNPAMMGTEMAAVGEAMAAMKMNQEMDTPVRRVRRRGGSSCSGTIVLVIFIAAILVAAYNSTGTAHDLLIRLMAQLNLSGLFH